jgi:transcriptional regulator with XRE-family HTH domain
MKDAYFAKEMGAWIAKVRRNRNMSQQQLADLSGKMLNTISNIERGLADPRAGTLIAIADALNIPASELFAQFHNAIIKKSDSELWVETVRLLRDLSDEKLDTARRILAALKD